MLKDQNLVQWQSRLLRLNIVKALENRLENLKKVNLRQYFGPMRDDQQVASLEDRLCPLVLVYVLQDIANVQSFFLRNLILPLDLANDTHKVKKGIFDLIRDLSHLLRKVLAKDLLNLRIADRVEFLQELLN